MQLSDLYQEVILDHYKRPRNKKKMDHPHFCTTMHNPSCGDVVGVEILVGDDGKVTDAAFHGHGCSISLASASILTTAVKGKTVDQAVELAHRFVGMMRGEPGNYSDLGELQALEGVSKYPLRVKCATLAWHALEKAVTKEGADDDGTST
jgi:nitrogen fixation protein NifU and related proteins